MNKNLNHQNKFKKYVSHYRQLIIQSPSKENIHYMKAKKYYNLHKKQFHQKNIKLNTFINKNYNFGLFLIGYDGQLKKQYNQLNIKTIVSNVEKMPMGKIEAKMNNKKLTLYENYHPKNSIQGLGFKNKETALNTIEKIKNKPIKYQLSVITTMLNRAKYHPHQTQDMIEAIHVYEEWLKNYHQKKQKGGKNKDYPFLKHNIINYYDTLAEHYDISKKARGLETPITTNKGFLQVYLQDDDAEKLKNIPVKKNNPNGANWYKTRINRINAKLGQMKSQNIPFFHTSGALKGLPTKMHTILIMWAYSPYESKIKQLMKNNILFFISLKKNI